MAVDGTKVKANASKPKSKTRKALREEEDKITRSIRAWSEEADRVDAEEDRRFGKEKNP